MIHHVHILDTGQQLIKGSKATGDKPCRDGLVACSTFEYTDHAPSDYTNGVDVHNGEGWTVRDNTLKRIRGLESEGYLARPRHTFLGTLKEYGRRAQLAGGLLRGIGIGLVQDRGDGSGPDHEGGTIRRQCACNLNAWADEGIEVNASLALGGA